MQFYIFIITRIFPRPIADDEDESFSPRYPDKVVEPEETYTRRAKKIITQPIDEDDDTDRITEITEVEKFSDEFPEDVERVTRKKDSVDKKLSQIVDASRKPKNGIPIEETDSIMFERLVQPNKEIRDDIDRVSEKDESLLTVSEKVCT